MAPAFRTEQIGDCTLILGDCREVLPTLGKVDAVVTDPPYGLGIGVANDKRAGHGLQKEPYASYEDTLDNFRAVVVPAVRKALEISKRGAVFCNHNLHELQKPDVIGGVLCPASRGRHCWGFQSFYPLGFYGVAPGLHFGSRPSAIVSSELPERNGHPCPKPLGWMIWVVGHATLSGETILDPFMGSGTTGVACVKLGRKFIGVEIEERYFQIACKRIDAACREPRLDLPEPVKPVQEAMPL